MPAARRPKTARPTTAAGAIPPADTAPPTSDPYYGSGQPNPRSAPPVPQTLLATPTTGLERRPGARSTSVVVIGGGLAGLVAAFELKRQGHRPIVLEARNRVGGRVHTLRDFAPGLYAEAGAMRIPRAHELTLAYCRLFNLPLRPFVMGNPRGLVYVDGIRMTMAEAQADPSRLRFELGSGERGRTADQLWEAAIGDLRRLVEREGQAAWDEIVRRYDQLSLYEFLRSKGWSEGAIEYYAVINFLEADLHNGVVEILREDIGRAYVDMQEIAGGMDALPNAFYAELQREVRFGAEVFAIDQDQDGVRVHYKTEARHATARGEYAICAIPFSVLRSIEITPEFSHPKRRAIRQLNYHASTKILFQVRERIWEADDGIQGGATVTDLGIRRINYPTPDPATSRGVLLASYTWGQDALQWGAMDEETRLEGGARRRLSRPPADPGGLRRGCLIRLVRRSVGEGSLRHVRAGAAVGAPGGDRGAGGPDPLRRGALLAVPRVDAGSPRVGHSSGPGDP